MNAQPFVLAAVGIALIVAGIEMIPMVEWIPNAVWITSILVGSGCLIFSIFGTGPR